MSNAAKLTFECVYVYISDILYDYYYITIIIMSSVL